MFSFCAVLFCVVLFCFTPVRQSCVFCAFLVHCLLSAQKSCRSHCSQIPDTVRRTNLGTLFLVVAWLCRPIRASFPHFPTSNSSIVVYFGDSSRTFPFWSASGESVGLIMFVVPLPASHFIIFLFSAWSCLNFLACERANCLLCLFFHSVTGRR